MNKYIYTFISCCVALLSITSCSESSTDSTEYTNWQATNDAYFETAYIQAAANSVSDPEHWKLLKATTKDKAEGKKTDYVIMQVISASGNTEAPEHTDSVRVHYRGFLLPSATHRAPLYDMEVGLCFDSSFYGNVLDVNTAIPVAFPVAGNNIVGFSTALQYMHPGDHCIVTIPYQLGYKDKDNNSIPAYSTLIFEITMDSFLKYGSSSFPKKQ